MNGAPGQAGRDDFRDQCLLLGVAAREDKLHLDDALVTAG
jgi:hypothetical protein